MEDTTDATAWRSDFMARCGACQGVSELRCADGIFACCAGAVSVRALTELASAHMLQHGVCFHFIVTWRADGRVTCG